MGMFNGALLAGGELSAPMHMQTFERTCVCQSKHAAKSPLVQASSRTTSEGGVTWRAYWTGAAEMQGSQARQPHTCLQVAA
jgi:hypothetical protein